MVKSADIEDIIFSAKRSSGPRKSKKIPPPIADELENFNATLNSSDEKTTILMITKQFIPKLYDASFPPPIS